MKPNATGHSVDLLLDVIAVLNRLKVPYATVGALAAAFYGVVRASLDADAVISLADIGLADLESSLRKKGYSVAVHLGDSTDPLAGTILVEAGVGNRVDLILGIRGMEDAAFGRIVNANLLGAMIQMIGLEDFIAMKLFAGGPMDLEDVRGVLRVSGSKIDRRLVRRLVKRYGRRTDALLRKMLAE